MDPKAPPGGDDVGLLVDVVVVGVGVEVVVVTELR